MPRHCSEPLLEGPPRRPDGMLRKLSTFSLVLVCLVFVLIIFVSHRLVAYNTFDEVAYQSVGRTIQSWRTPDFEANFGEDDNASEVILQVVSEERQLISLEMEGYNYTNIRADNAIRGLSNLVPELGGQPLRSIIITTWRSGSTFLGDILNSHPGNFYHYEPLLDYGIVQIRGPPSSESALAVLESLLNCNYTGLGSYLRYGKDHTWLFNHNTRLWEECQSHPELCWLPEFLNPFCRIFPFQSMKVVRLRLHLMEKLLSDKRLNVRVLLLVRDPRGTLQSRKHRDWCPNNPDCDRPSLLCADLIADYAAAVKLTKMYPDRLMVMRYEDLSLDPYVHVHKLFEFYGLDFHPNVKQFLDTHTKVDVGGVSSTFRNSKSAPFHWRQDLSHKEVRNIQYQCGPALRYWGYVKAQNKTHQRDFNPIKQFTLK